MWNDERMNVRRLQVWALDGIPEVSAGDDLAQLIGDAWAADADEVRDGDVLVVTSKVVSKAEGRMLPASDREDAITSETVRVVATRATPNGGTTRIVWAYSPRRLWWTGAEIDQWMTRFRSELYQLV